MGEVLDIDADGAVTIWFLWDASQDPAKYQAKKPLGQWKSAPEWVDRQGRAVPVVPEEDKDTKVTRRLSTLYPEEMEIIVASFTAERKVGGGFLPELTKKVDEWIRKQRISLKRKMRILTSPTAAEVDELEAGSKRT